MLRIIICLAFALGLLKVSFCQEEELIGEWTGQDVDQNIGSFVFDSLGYVTIGFQGQKFGGQNYLYKDTITNLTYEVDTSESPRQLILFLREKKSNECLKTMKFIYKLDSRASGLVIGITDDMEKFPLSFRESNIITFEKRSSN